MKPIRVMIVDDQGLFREGLRAVLSRSSAVEVVAEAANGREALRLVHGEDVDVVLMDLRMAEMDGVEATRRLTSQRPDLPVLVLTTFDDDELVFDALRARARGYLLKDTPVADIIDAIVSAHRGDSVLAPAVTRKVLDEFSRVSHLGTREPPSELKLTPRETEVLRMLGHGATNKQIGAALGIAEGTVKNHLSNIYEKLDVDERTSAALKAREFGLI